MWFLIFERTATERSPAANIVHGTAAGSGQSRAPAYRTVKPLMVLEADSAKAALYAASQKTRVIGDYYAVEVAMRTIDVLPPELPYA